MKAIKVKRLSDGTVFVDSDKRIGRYIEYISFETDRIYVLVVDESEPPGFEDQELVCFRDGLKRDGDYSYCEILIEDA